MTAPKQNKDALGKGIRSLLQSIDTDLKNTSGQLKESAVEAVTSVLRISVLRITSFASIKSISLYFVHTSASQ